MRINRRVFVAAGISVTAAALAARHSLARELAQPIVETAHGKVRGLVADNGIQVFKGMRYAASSSGALRFMPPTSPTKWTGIQDAFEYGDQSPTSARLTRRCAGNVRRLSAHQRMDSWPG